MRSLCPTCQTPIVTARAAVGGDDVVLAETPAVYGTAVQLDQHRAVVGGFAWEPADVIAAIAIEVNVSPMPDALAIALGELDWHRVHECAGKVPVPA